MGEALFELEQVLRSKNGKLTGQEREILLACRSKAIRDFSLGGSVAAGLVWMATRKLNNFLRINLAGGAAIISGMWRLSKSLDSCAEQILAWDGSRMQHELAKIMVQRYGNDPRKKKLISKHFYSEKVFDDSTSDRPISIYRQRNTFVDNAANIHRSLDINTHSDGNENDTNYPPRKNDSDIPRQKRMNSESMQVHINPGSYVLADPFECLFGYSGATEEIHHPAGAGAGAPAREQSCSQRRLHRRHRMRHRHREEPSTLEKV
ncbi:hypothetical protein Nepgr_020667 [Nepenthes gracilis]|uniref:Uncharacterized protein n=1 Tax=Nepenthes gracilis TaxID=150966 RepID=A0AAD3XWL5_NEPGR|nr:hypothetical protein Nepgr_020667 [Nepenthes gracilis]